MTHLLDHPLIGARYFFPRPGALPKPLIVTCNDHELHCYQHRPHPGAKTIVHFHGNGEIAHDFHDQFVEALAMVGLNTMLAEYRGYGSSSGKPALVSMLDDVPAIIDAAGIPRDEVILFGRSIGSIYAIHGASVCPDVAGLVLESSIADVRQRLLMRVTPAEVGTDQATFDAACAEHFDHQAKFAAYPGPVLVMHTRHDGLVDLDHAERNHAWAAGRKRLLIFEQGNHNNIIGTNAPAYFTAVKEFAEQLP